MKDKSCIVSSCLLLILVAQLGFLKAEETTSGLNVAVTENPIFMRKGDEAKNKEKDEREEIFKKSFENTMKTYEQLKEDKDKMFRKLKDLLENPKPFPNITKIINQENEVISLKVAFEEIWPKFWKVPRRKQCAKLFDQKVEDLIVKIILEIEIYYKNILISLLEYSQSVENGLEEEKEKIKADYKKKLNDCTEWNFRCNIIIFIKLDSITEFVEYAETIVNRLDDIIKGKVFDLLDKYIKTSLLNPVRECLNQ